MTEHLNHSPFICGLFEYGFAFNSSEAPSSEKKKQLREGEPYGAKHFHVAGRFLYGLHQNVPSYSGEQN